MYYVCIKRYNFGYRPALEEGVTVVLDVDGPPEDITSEFIFNELWKQYPHFKEYSGPRYTDPGWSSPIISSAVLRFARVGENAVPEIPGVFVDDNNPNIYNAPDDTVGDPCRAAIKLARNSLSNFEKVIEHLADRKASACLWALIKRDSYSDTWESGCGRRYNLKGRIEVGAGRNPRPTEQWTYCPNCSNKIQESS